MKALDLHSVPEEEMRTMVHKKYDWWTRDGDYAIYALGNLVKESRFEGFPEPIRDMDLRVDRRFVLRECSDVPGVFQFDRHSQVEFSREIIDDQFKWVGEDD